MSRDHCWAIENNEVKRLMSHHMARDQWSQYVWDSFHYSALTNDWNRSLLEWVRVWMFSCGKSWSARQDLSFESIHDHTLMICGVYVLFECMCVHRSGHDYTDLHFHAWWLLRILLSSMRPFIWGTICLCSWEKVSKVTFRPSKCIGCARCTLNNFLFFGFHASVL